MSVQELTDLSQGKGIDWRTKGAVAGVPNLGQCGNSDLFATVNMIESAHFIASGKMESFSHKQIMRCGAKNPCSGGYITSLDYVAKNGLMRTEDFTSSTTCEEAQAKPAVKVEKVVKVKSMSDTELEAALLKSPVKVAIEADTMTFQAYHSGIISGASCGTSLNHVALAVGWEMQGDTKYYIVQNEWGSSWGDHGYVKIAAVPGAGICGI